MEITVAFRSGAIRNGPCLIRKRSGGPPLFTGGAGIRRANVMPILRFVPCPCGSSAHPPCMIGSRRTIHTTMVYRSMFLSLRKPTWCLGLLYLDTIICSSGRDWRLHGVINVLSSPAFPGSGRQLILPEVGNEYLWGLLHVRK